MRFITLRDSGTVRIFTSSTAERSPFPSRGRTRARSKVGETANVGRDTFQLAASEALPRCGLWANAPLNALESGRDSECRAWHALSRRGEAHRRVGWVGGVHPSAPLKARTAASDGQRAFTRAARSAGLRFAVRPLSEAMDRKTTKSGAWVGTSSTADAVPLPLVGEGLSAVESGVRLTMSGVAL